MWKQNKLICLIVLIFFCLAGKAQAMDLEKKVVKAKLKNGLTVLMLDRKFSPTVSLYIRHRVGAVDESKGQTGAAHLLEHMMFKGTPSIGTKNFAKEKKLLAQIEKTGQKLDAEKKKGEKADKKIVDELTARLKTLQEKERKYYIPNEIDRLYTENGGMDMNASTGQDVTTYYVSLPANKIELWARIESDRLLHPVFREFYTERSVVLEERGQRVESNPDGKLYEAFMKTAYTVHPYRLPILGLSEDVKIMNQDAIRNIHRRYASPSHIVIAVVGDIDPQKTIKLIDRYFGRIPETKPADTVIPVEPLQVSQRKVEISFDANPMMIIGYHKPNAPAADDYVFDVLETLLSKGRTSRFYSRLVVEKQLADSISASNGIPATRYPNLFAIFAKPKYPHTLDELQKAIDIELDSIIATPVPEEELAKAKKQMKMDFIKSLDSNSELASTLSYYELLQGDYRYFSNYIPQIEKVTASDIQRIAAFYLTAEKRTVATLIPRKESNKNEDSK